MSIELDRGGVYVIELRKVVDRDRDVVREVFRRMSEEIILGAVSNADENEHKNHRRMQAWRRSKLRRPSLTSLSIDRRYELTIESRPNLQELERRAYNDKVRVCVHSYIK